MSHSTLHTPHFILHKSHSTLHTSHFTMHFHTSKHITFSNFSHRQRATTPLETPKATFAWVPQSPAPATEMRFHTSQNITFSHFPHRQGDDAIREPQNENGPQRVHHSQTPKKENKNPFATHSGKKNDYYYVCIYIYIHVCVCYI